MNTLVIVESPAKAKTIEKYLGEGHTVKASVGHVRDLPKSNKNAIDIPHGFLPRYEVAKGKDKILAELSAAVKRADEVVLATDPDREGEAIAWHLAEALGLATSKKKTVKRVTFNEITKDAVQEAFKHPREIDQNLRKAQEARRVLDRLVGYDLSGLIWKKCGMVSRQVAYNPLHSAFSWNVSVKYGRLCPKTTGSLLAPVRSLQENHVRLLVLKNQRQYKRVSALCTQHSTTYGQLFQ